MVFFFRKYLFRIFIKVGIKINKGIGNLDFQEGLLFNLWLVFF